jgi:cation:H+ antiporter
MSLNFIFAASSPASPLFYVALFVAASFVMIWRLEAMIERGVEGTVLGTLVMPYCSGLGNLIFVFVLLRAGGNGGDVMTNCLVNNVTNMTLLIGLPALIWGMNLMPSSGRGKRKQANREQRVRRLSLLLTLTAVLFFTGAVWALGRDERLDFGDGLVLVGLFLFWQCFHVFDVLKSNVRQNRTFSWMLVFDLALLGFGACAIYLSVEWVVNWISSIESGFFRAERLGWVTGWLMVLPNGLLAMYYGWRRRPDVLYSSQVGDGHICIPLCIGLFALYKPIDVSSLSNGALVFLLAAVVVHGMFLGVFGRLPRFAGLLAVIAYGVYLKLGLSA